MSVRLSRRNGSQTENRQEQRSASTPRPTRQHSPPGLGLAEHPTTVHPRAFPRIFRNPSRVYSATFANHAYIPVRIATPKSQIRNYSKMRASKNKKIIQTPPKRHANTYMYRVASSIPCLRFALQLLRLALLLLRRPAPAVLLRVRLTLLILGIAPARALNVQAGVAQRP